MPRTGATACASCSLGRFQNATGALACHACTAGTFAPATNATGCKLCAVGHFAAAEASSSCDGCAVGRFQPKQGQHGCKACAKGRYQTSTASTRCVTCAAGYYQDVMGQETCVVCASGRDGFEREAMSADTCHQCSMSASWSSWSGCDKSCGGGIRSRSRHLVGSAAHFRAAIRQCPVAERQTCNLQLCPGMHECPSLKCTFMYSKRLGHSVVHVGHTRNELHNKHHCKAVLQPATGTVHSLQHPMHSARHACKCYCYHTDAKVHGLLGQTQSVTDLFKAGVKDCWLGARYWCKHPDTTPTLLNLGLPLSRTDLSGVVASTGKPHYTAGAKGHGGNIHHTDGWSGSLPIAKTQGKGEWSGWTPVHSTGFRPNPEPPAVRANGNVWPEANI